MDEGTLIALLERGAQIRASDLILKVGQPPGFRVHGDIHYVQSDPLRPEQTRLLAKAILDRSRYEGSLEKLTEYDTSYAAPNLGRYRVNIYRQRGSLAVAMRSIPLAVPSYDELGLPPVVAHIANYQRGLVLVVGAAGNGKSTTLAAMVSQINKSRRCHIITIEDPIEYMHEDELACVSQREIGLDTPSFPVALRAALRQDPDVILLGEIRDEETMDIALKAAETGHLVLSTLHTPDVARTVGRVLALGVGAERDPKDTRERFADNLKAIIAQRLLPRADRPGQALATEILVMTGTAKESMRSPQGNLPLKDIMERGAHPYGMQSFRMDAERLVKQGLVTVESARAMLE